MGEQRGSVDVRLLDIGGLNRAQRANLIALPEELKNQVRSQKQHLAETSGLGSRSRLKKNRSRSWSRLEKKSGAGAANKLAGSSDLLEDKKQKEIVLLLLFFTCFIFFTVLPY